MKINLKENNVAADKQRPKLLLIIPCFNEEANLKRVTDELREVDLPIATDVLIVNDGSTDATGNILWRSGVKHTTNPFNMGYGSCLQVGYKYAARHNYSFVIQMDADGQHDVSNIRNLYDELIRRDEEGDYPDIVLGSRFMKESSPFKVGPLKKVAFVWFRFLLRVITGNKEKLWDPTTGLQGLSRKAFVFYSYYGNFDTRFPDVNMLTQMMLLGMKVRQIPAIMHQRVGGISMHTGLAKQGRYMIHMTLSIIGIAIREKWMKADQSVVANVTAEIKEHYYSAN